MYDSTSEPPKSPEINGGVTEAPDLDKNSLFTEARAQWTPAPPRSLFNRQEWAIIVVTSLGHSLCHLAELIFPAVMVAVLTEFDLERNQVTRMVLLGYVLLGVGALPVGLWADAWDPWKIHLIYCGGMLVGCLAVAFSPTREMLFLSLTLLGVALSMYHPIALSMISLGIRSRGLAMGINGVAGSLGISLAPLVGQWACSLDWWRLAYVIVAGWAVISGLAMFFFWKDRFHIDQAHEKITASTSKPDRLRISWTTQLLLLVVMMLGGLNYRSMVTALPTFLSGEDSAAGQIVRGGFFASLVMLAGCLGQILGGRLGDRFGARPVYVVCVAALIPLFALVGVLGGTLAVVLAASLMSVCMFGQQPLENSLMAENTSIRRRSISYGWKFALTFGVGALGTQVVGEIWQATESLAPVFYLLSGSAVVMVILLGTFLRREAREKMSSVL